MSCAQACSIFFFSAKGLYYFLTMLKVNVVTGKLGKFTSPTFTPVALITHVSFLPS